MLLLSRRLNERVFIGHDIIITVVKLGNGQVRFGIDAPANLPVHREEIYNRIHNPEPRTQENKFNG